VPARGGETRVLFFIFEPEIILCMPWTPDLAILSSSQRDLSIAPKIIFPDSREAEASQTPLGPVG
jgi:hypothetical protein